MSVRIGIIGCGNVVLRRHLPALLTTPGIEVGAVADPTPGRLEAARQGAELSESDAFTDWRDVLGRPDIDALLIATPQRFRPAIARAGAAAGKHLLCEKPLASAPAEAWGMIEAARRGGVVLATVHNYVFAPVYQAIKAVVDSGELGEVELAMLNFLGVEDRPGTEAYQPRWRHETAESGGGVLMDMLHAVYLANWFLGANAVAVSAAVDRRRGGEGDVEDLALVRYDYPHGHAMVNVAWGEGPGGVVLAGTRGRLVLVNQDHGTYPFVPPKRIEVFAREGSRSLRPDPDHASSFAGVAADFRDAVAKGRSPAATGEDGLRVLESVVGAYASAALRREVALPLSASDPVYLRGALGIAELLPLEQDRRRHPRLFGARVPSETAALEESGSPEPTPVQD